MDQWIRIFYLLVFAELKKDKNDNENEKSKRAKKTERKNSKN
jgi:hypothetical protein